jgi:hypothetical protein
MTDQPTTPATPPAAMQAGWYPDPTTGHQRWWDGKAWTDHTAPAAAPTPGPVGQQQLFVTYQKNSTNGVALAAVILGAVGAGLSLIPLLGPFLCWLPALLGIIFGFVGLSNAKKLNGLRKNAALWGVILGFAPIPISIIWLVIGAIGSAASGNS